MNNDKDYIGIGTILRHTKLTEFWTITDCYFNLNTEECEFLAKSDDSDRGLLYIPQSVMLKDLDNKTLIIESEVE